MLLTIIAFIFIFSHDQNTVSDKDLLLQALVQLARFENDQYSPNIEKGYSLCNQINYWRTKSECLDWYYKARAIIEKDKQLCKKRSTAERQDECLLHVSFGDLDEKNETDLREYESICEQIQTQSVIQTCTKTIELWKKQGYFQITLFTT